MYIEHSDNGWIIKSVELAPKAAGDRQLVDLFWTGRVWSKVESQAQVFPNYEAATDWAEGIYEPA
jgi:hypothetical protein